jgi:hypothetical protein
MPITDKDKEIVCIINSGCRLEIGQIYKPQYYVRNDWKDNTKITDVCLDDGFEYAIERFISIQNWVDLKLKTL